MTPPPAGTGAAPQPFDPRSLYSSASPAGTAAKTSAAAQAPSSSTPSNGAVKREPSTADDADSSPGAGSAAKKKPSKRRKVNLACIYCRRSHMTCDEGRPCQRCIKRDIGHLCHDEATPAKAHHDGHKEEASSSATATPSKPAKAQAAAGAKVKKAAASASPTDPASSSATAQNSTSIPAAETAVTSTTTADNFFPTLGLAGTAASANDTAVFSSTSSGPYSSVSPMSSLNQNNANNASAAEFNAASMFKPQAGATSMQPTASASSNGGAGGISAAGMLSLASLFNNNNNNNSVNDLNNAGGVSNANTASGMGPAVNQQQAGAGGGGAGGAELSGLGGAGWLGLGGGPGGYEGGGSGFGGDSAGGNEFTLLSEFLESLDGPGFGAGATPGMTGTSALAGTGSGSGFTPSQSRRNTISGWTSGNTFDGLTALTPIQNTSAAEGRSSVPAFSSTGGNAGTVYNSGSANAAGGTNNFGSGVVNSGNNSNSGVENGTGKRSRRSSFSATLAGGGSGSGGATAANSSGAASGSYLPSLQGGSSKTERFFLTAADQKDGTRDERLAGVIQAKYEAGLLRPYNHVNGYARLNRWMERNVSAASKRRILKPLSVFRPAFRAVAQSLTNIDLVFIEEAFERLLLDYDRVFSTQGIPACLWRRTGEIYKGNKEFAELVGVPIESLREGRLCIYELMAEESAVNYWEKYGAVSFDPGQKAVLTSCVLRTKNKAIVATSWRDARRSGPASGQITPNPAIEKEDAKEAGAVAAGTGATSTSGVLKDPNNPKAAFIHCCFSFTIRRDQWNIPHMIVGNFLPTNPS
ncbi:related to RDS2-Regulator of drug sensitivity [Sporisorium reilianum SRZ2]|uniref:Related to RDS2-Regulator of drug sensitivity n=1 Tax=Sporisorium reilianum (strain SRZ2) TaxID=999809 RepID=E6ZMT4_SPORE|nr:related to RDS2-Regulator of drug sensitivity [Sporisorium reilianum SRZ2]